MIINIGDWIRFYTTSLRGDSTTTSIGKVTAIHKDKDGNIISYDAENAVMGFTGIFPHDITGTVVVDLTNRVIVSG